jgi:lambda family phage portal protein
VLEALLAAISPRWALRRAQERAALWQVQARYDAARRMRRNRYWRADGTGPNAETEGAIAELRNKARDLVRNSAWAASALDMSIAYQVGYGITPRSRTGDEDTDKGVNAAFAAWAARCDLAGRLDFGGIQAQAARGRMQDGEAIVLLIALTAPEMRRRGLSVPLALQMVEPDLLPESIGPTSAGNNRVVQGVEIDAAGRPVAYHVLEDHPGEQTGAGLTGRTRRIPAENVLHVFRQDRPGQVRGVSDFAPAMLRLRDLDELEEAALHAAKVQACLAAFVTSNQPSGRGPLEKLPEDGGDPVRSFSPGMIERLLPGEDVKFVAPGGAGSFNELARHQLHAIAAALGLTYDLVTGDLSQANYSSLRAGRLAVKRKLEQLQWLLLIPRLCEPIWRAWVEAALRVGVLDVRDGGYPVEWSPPPFEMVDPLKDAEAARMMMRMGLRTWPQMVAEQGFDPEAQIADIAKWNAAFDASKVILDSDPRRTAGTGGAQNPAQNAAIELRQ